MIERLSAPAPEAGPPAPGLGRARTASPARTGRPCGRPGASRWPSSAWPPSWPGSWSPYSPPNWRLTRRNQFAPLGAAPSHLYLFGTDELGRDVFTRVLYGARLSMPLAVLLVLVAMTIGSALGATAGFFRPGRRRRDNAHRRPRFRLPRASSWPWPSPPPWALAEQRRPRRHRGVLAVVRPLVRGLVLAARSSEYVTSARLLGQFRLGAPSGWSCGRTSPGRLFVLAALDIGNAVLLLSGLSFLGLGAKPPTAEWGSMVSEGVQNFNNWWIGLFPGLAILTVVLAFNFIGDALRDMLDPRTARMIRK